MANELVPYDQRFVETKKFLEAPSVVKQLAVIVTNGINPNRLLRQAVSLCSDSPDLCSCSPKSIILGIVKAAELGLELSGPLGQAYLVPRNVKGVKTATFQVGWRGLVALAFRSGLVASFSVRTVFENDDLLVTYGVNQDLQHMPSNEPRTVAKGYYAVVRFLKGGFDFEYMTREEIQDHRKKYGGSGPGWNNSFDAMAQKTVARRLCRRLSMCPEAQKQAMEEEYVEEGIGFKPEFVKPVEVANLLEQAAPLEFDGGPDPSED